MNILYKLQNPAKCPPKQHLSIMKRTRNSSDDECLYAVPREENLEVWFRQIGLRFSHVVEAARHCEAQGVNSVSGLQAVYRQGQLAELLPHSALCTRIEAQFQMDESDLLSEDDEMAMKVEKTHSIHIKHDGVSISIDVSTSTTMQQIKEHLASNTCFGYAPCTQQLVYCGRQLSNNKSLGSYAIEPYSCLYLIVDNSPGR